MVDYEDLKHLFELQNIKLESLSTEIDDLRERLRRQDLQLITIEAKIEGLIQLILSRRSI